MVERPSEAVQAAAFLLRPATHHPQPISISHISPQSQPACFNFSKTSPLPVFNHDRLFFTPAFILNFDRNYYEMNRAFEGQKFEWGRKDSLGQIQKQELYVAHPLVNFCQICRLTYLKYQSHLSSRSHKLKLQASKGDHYINQLCLTLCKTTSCRPRKTAKSRVAQGHLRKKVKKKTCGSSKCGKQQCDDGLRPTQSEYPLFPGSAAVEQDL